MSKHAVALALCAISLYGVSEVEAQDFPSKTIRIITGTAGGITDLVSRLISQGVSANVGQPVVVDNRGGGGVIVGPLLAKSPPDGYTTLLYSSTVWLTPLMRDNPTYDALRDMALITIPAESTNVLVVHPSVPAKNVKELIALAKAHPGVLNYASTGSGASPHLAAELLKSMAKVNITRINYKGTPPAMTDVMSGQVQMMFAPPTVAMPIVKSGKLRVIGVTGRKRSDLLPDVPTIGSQVSGYEMVSMYGMFVPVKTPAPVITRLNQEVVRVLKLPDIRTKMLDSGAEPVGNSPQEATALIRAEVVRLGKVIKEANIKED
jgi:tripartite-type tricarboxylate transporter receptor subunit TctC